MLADVLDNASQVFGKKMDNRMFNHIFGEHSEWIAANYEKLFTDIYNLKEGERFSIQDYIKENFNGDEGCFKSLFCMIPYLTGAFGLLELSFEIEGGGKVTVKHINDVSVLGEKAMKCYDEAGTELDQNKVFVIFTRNNKT